MRRRPWPLPILLLLAACGPAEGPGRFDHLQRLGADTADEEVLSIPRPELLPRVDPEDLPPGLDPYLEGREGMVYDPITYLGRRRNHSVRITWPEHPAGGYERRTNGFGMREDTDPAEQRPDLRILVTGDSHTDGVVENQESFPNVLEARLGGVERGVEVLNAGCGYYSFPNYLGVLVKYLPLEPHAFVVCVYGGNDFGVLPSTLLTLRGEPLPAPNRDYRERIGAAQLVEVRGRSGAESVAQGFNQLAFLHAYPEERASILASAVDYTEAIAELCRQRGIRFVLVYLPPPLDAQREIFAEMHDRVAEAMRLDESALGATDRLADEYLAAVRAAGVEVVDARPSLRAAEEPVYWLRDEHLNVAGHRIVAGLLEPLFRGE